MANNKQTITRSKMDENRGRSSGRGGSTHNTPHPATHMQSETRIKIKIKNK